MKKINKKNKKKLPFLLLEHADARAAAWASESEFESTSIACFYCACFFPRGWRPLAVGHCSDVDDVADAQKSCCPFAATSILALLESRSPPIEPLAFLDSLCCPSLALWAAIRPSTGILSLLAACLMRI